jgi:Ca2+-binding EF-hand superfamily protein
VVVQEDLLGNHPHLKHYRHIHPQTILVNLDVTLQLIAEAMLNKSATVGERIRQIFVEGDTNHDGVLSFTEFMDIVNKVAPEYHERKILKMFREALMKGTASLLLCWWWNGASISRTR